jgi:acetamidase/formamidase
MKQATYNKFSVVILIISLFLTFEVSYLSWSQHNIDYDKSVLIVPGPLPVVKISEGETILELEVANTSKANVTYFLRADTNMGCLTGENSKPQLYPCRYESQMVSLSKYSAGKDTYAHKLSLDAQNGSVGTHPLSLISPAEYYLSVSIIDVDNGRILYNSKCFYVYHIDAKVFTLDQPVLDTSGESGVRQANCRA